jgi:recombinational DNA repair protein (RecF pathway)
MTPDVAQLLIDALRSLLAGSSDGLEQARVKVEQAQQLLLGDEPEYTPLATEAVNELLAALVAVRAERNKLVEALLKARPLLNECDDAYWILNEALAAVSSPGEGTP